MIEHLGSKFPNLTKHPLDDLISTQLFSPHSVPISKKTLDQMSLIIKTLFNLRTKKEYVQYFSKELTDKGLIDPGNHSILMSYDFHIDENENPKLIEINTNASFLALGYEMYLSRKIPFPVPEFQITDLKKNIENELRIFDEKNGPRSRPDNLSIAIVDEKPPLQRLYIEFLLYQEIFNSWGWKAQILDTLSPDLDEQLDFIYNRSTDFFLENTNSKKLNDFYKLNKVCISPNPYEYFLLANKKRLIDWLIPGFLKSMVLDKESWSSLDNSLLNSFQLNEETKDKAWTLRKKLFFKPQSSYGSKQAYRGDGISKKKFELLIEEGPFLAQEYCPPPNIDLMTSRGTQTFKYDLRCFSYEDQMQLVVARLYQGQITNLQTSEGGYAPIIIK